THPVALPLPAASEISPALGRALAGRMSKRFSGSDPSLEIGDGDQLRPGTLPAVEDDVLGVVEVVFFDPGALIELEPLQKGGEGIPRRAELENNPRYVEGVLRAGVCSGFGTGHALLRLGGWQSAHASSVSFGG